MFESLKIKHELSKADYDAQEPLLRGQLIDTQFDLLESGDFPVITLLSGMDIPGRSATAKQLFSWMDPRHLRPFAMVRPSEEERVHPRMWRFWRGLPRRGRIGLFLNSWHEGPMRDYFLGRIDHAQFKDHIDEILRFEKMLADEGALFVKFMFLLPKKQNLKNLKKLKKERKIAWKVSEEELEIGKQFAKKYDHAVKVVEELVSKTDTPLAPWIPIASADARYRDITVGQTLCTAIRNRLAEAPPPVRKRRAARVIRGDSPNILDGLDLSQSLEREDYKRRLKEEQQRLTDLTLSRKFEDRSLVVAFEGNDAAGKGGGIRRIVQALDPRMMRVIPIAAPSTEEKEQPYLWRFWRHVPQKGRITIFDRTWYGRVLVERVEGFCSEADWRRAYQEIRFFESELTDFGAVMVKFWLALDKKEQLRRFKEREKVGYKRYKITDEDWRNRRKWNVYAEAVHDMVDETSTSYAPWTLVEANDKLFARVKILKTVNDRLEAEL